MHRYKEIDFARAISTILIVIGHVVTQAGVDDRFIETLGNCIYSFHIYVFFFVSGIVATKDIFRSTDRKQYIKKRFEKLMIPYFVMGLVYIPFRVIMSRFARSEFNVADSWKILIGNNPDGSLWFLYMLFFISVISLIILKKETARYLLPISFLLWVVSCIFKPGVDFVLSICRYTFTFMLGVCARAQYQKYHKLIYNNTTFLISIVVFVLANYVNQKQKTEVLLPLTATSGVLIVLYVSSVLSKANEDMDLYKGLNTIGKYCMEIYIFGEPIKVILRTLVNKAGINVYIGMPIIIVGTIVGPILLSIVVIHRSKILSFMFLGKRERGL